MQSNTDRDLDGLAAKRDRESVPRGEFDEDDLTGKYEGAALEVERAKRPTPNRIARLERKNDLLVANMLAADAWRRRLIWFFVTSITSGAIGYFLHRGL